MNPFQAYELYLAIKQHFSREKYDFHKFNGKVNTSVKAFENRSDKSYFFKLSKIKNLQDHILSNMIIDPNIWVGDLLNAQAELNYNRWLSRNSSIFYNFKKEVKLLFPEIKNNLTPIKGQYPSAYVLYRQGEISPETLVILNSYIKFLPYWDQHISDPISYPTNSLILKKYEPFVKFDKNICKKFLKSEIDSHK